MKYIKILFANKLQLLFFMLFLFSCTKHEIDEIHPTPKEKKEIEQIKKIATIANEVKVDSSKILPKKSVLYTPIKITQIAEDANPAQIEYDIWKNGKIDSNYVYTDTICFQSPQNYSTVKGITTFRGNNYRDLSAIGEVAVKKESLQVLWKHKIGNIDNWSGIGWTGQPAIIEWDQETKLMMNIKKDKKLKKQLTEVIYSALDGNIYFLDLEDGTSTRDSISFGYPLKGSVMIDPYGLPLLFQGIGINRNGKNYTDFQYRVYNLINQKKLDYFPGIPKIAFRKWGAFDSSGLIKDDYLFLCGENGLIYKTKLNTKFDKRNKKITISPQTTNYRYKNPFRDKIGVENSPVIYKNLWFIPDNGGLLQCLDINTMKPIWAIDLEDDVDGSLVLEETSEGVFLYCGNENDLRGKAIYQTKPKDKKNIKKKCSLRKINALTGKVVWKRDYDCYYHPTNGGVLGTPIVGKGKIDSLVIFNIARTDSLNKGKIVALHKKNGKTVWEKKLNNFSWCSPACFYSKKGKAYLLYGDYRGNFYLVEAKTGKSLQKLDLQGTIECSPVVFNDMVILGTKNKEIICLKIH